MIASWQESDDKPRQYVEKQRKYSADKGLYSQDYGLPGGNVRLWELDCKESRIPKNWCLRTVALEKTPESPLDSKQIKPVNLKGNQPWIPWKDWCWSWSSRILVIWCEQPTHWKSLWCWERLKAGEEGIRGWDGWMASTTQWTWTWINFGKWWGTGSTGML